MTKNRKRMLGEHREAASSSVLGRDGAWGKLGKASWRRQYLK